MFVSYVILLSIGCSSDKGSDAHTGTTEDTQEDTEDTNEQDTSPDTDTDTAQETAEPVQRVAKSLVIIWDGARPDALAKANTPNMDSLINGTWHPEYQGAYSPLAQNLYDATTVSGPNHSTIMTGATGSQHGVTGNGDVGGGDFVTYPHYLQILEGSNPELNTACLFTWGTDALIPSGADFIYDGGDGDNIDRVVDIVKGTFSADAWTEGTNPDAVFLFLDDSDHAGHAHGFEMGIQEYNDEMQELDTQIGTILSALQARPTFDEESWQLVFTSDHGGYHTNHYGNSASEHTIPFLVAGRDVEQGRLPLDTSIVDVVPTVLSHHGIAISSELTGTARGGQVVSAPSSPASLLRYYTFDGTLDDASTSNVSAQMGSESDHDPVLHPTDGKFGGYLSIADYGGGSGDSSYLTLGSAQDLQFGESDSFTVTLWFKSDGIQSGDPLILGNKNWNSGANQGWLLSANEGGGNSFGTNHASDASGRVDIEDLDYSADEWWFLATVVHPGELAVLYAGNADGLRWIAHRYPEPTDLTSGLPLNLGQDGTGSYSHNLAGDVDDLAIWNRALGFEEVQALYASGAGITAEEFTRE